jgi:serine/threonine protein kinase/class 3 adenylate cyclase
MPARRDGRSGLRLVTIFFSDISGFSEVTRKMGDLEASKLTNRLLTMQEIIITRDGLGQVLQFGGDSVFAVFQNASVALNRALEIQRVLDGFAAGNGGAELKLRIGLHMGEVLIEEGERMEIISRHVNRAHRVMEAATPGQILASDVVVDAGRDFIEIPREHQAVRHYGEFYLKGVGVTGLCEVADLRFRIPESPRIQETHQGESSLISRLELAGYTSVERLGEGASGVVFKARPEGSPDAVAIKVLNPSLCDDESARTRFSNEVERTRRLNLEGTARVLNERLDHRPPFYVMEYVEGLPADQALQSASANQIAQVFLRLCATLERAHAAGVIHCDLKPGNVLVRGDGSAVILDFGLSAVFRTELGTRSASQSGLGTPSYLAPESVRGESPTPATDVYSLGVLLFKVLAGREPFEGKTVHQVIQGHLHEDPPPPALWNPQVADGLQRICLKALEKRPEDRYQDARQMAADLERFLRGELIRTRPSAYDNLLFHRVQKHVEQIKEWAATGLLNAEESHRLLSSYEGLQRRGLPAVMEGRLFRFWRTLVYIGGWAVINGALLWLLMHWDELSTSGRLFLGSVPAISTMGVAAVMWRIERFRLFFVALIIVILATPLLAGVWLHEFKIGARVEESRKNLELVESGDNPFTNQQILLTATAMLVMAGAVMGFTRTTTHSAQTVIALALLYGAWLLRGGLKPDWEAEKFARIALEFLPLLAVSVGIGVWLLRQDQRLYQAPPWIYFGALVFLAISMVLPLHGLKEWSELDPQSQQPLSFMLLSLAGAVQVVGGLAARHYLQHRCRGATLGVIFVGLVTFLAGLGLAALDNRWPEGWWTILILGKPVPFPHAIFPWAALAVTLLACRYQMFSFLLVGLAGIGCSVHGLGHLYFEKLTAWPRALMVVGAACFFLALFFELRRTKGNTIDDVVNQARL